jgi:site-specific DNA-methyltransferase (adenine-specific)
MQEGGSSDVYGEIIVRPYFQESNVVIYHGDCREILPTLPKVDLVLTDPPYGVGIGEHNNQAKSGGYGGHLAKGAYLSFADTYENFVSIVVPALNIAIGKARCAAVFSGPHIHEQAKPTSIGGVWYPSATGRTPWGSKNFLPVLLYGNPPGAGQHRPTVIQTSALAEDNGHPCPKPLEWLLWLVRIGSREGDLILDPFAGSGTTAVAAKKLGRRCIAVEIEEKYCEIAARRIQEASMPLFDVLRPIQMEIARDDKRGLSPETGGR